MLHYERIGGGGRPSRRAAASAVVGLIAVLAAVALLASFQGQNATTTLASSRSGSSLASLERDTFANSDEIYKSQLARARKEGSSSQSMAWAAPSSSSSSSSSSPSGLTGDLAKIEEDMAERDADIASIGDGEDGRERGGRRGRGEEVEDGDEGRHEERRRRRRRAAARAGGGERGLVGEITRAVTRQVLGRMADDRDGRRRRGRDEQASRRSRRSFDVLRGAQRHLDEDRAKQERDEASAERLLRQMTSLARTFDEPQYPEGTEPSRAPLPLSDDLQPMAVGPYSDRNYYHGDHYHDDAGPAGVKIDTFGHGGGQGEEGEEDGDERADDSEANTQDSGEDAAAGEEGEQGGDVWAKRDNREKLQKLGVNVMSSAPQWVTGDSGPEEADEREKGEEDGKIRRLHAAGVVTDRLPLLGADYSAAIPLPGYHENGPASSDDLNGALEEGHRWVDHGEGKLKEEGVNVVAGNALLPRTVQEGQRRYPYLDGVPDKMVDKHTATRHAPLWFMLDDPKKKSKALEGHGVNVWGSPMGRLIPKGFFGGEGGEDDEGSEKLKEAGVRVDRLSAVPEHAPVPRDAK